MTEENPWAAPDPHGVVPWPGTVPMGAPVPPADPTQPWAVPYGQHPPPASPAPPAHAWGMPPYQHPGAWDRRDSTNALAVLALVCGVLPLFPVAIPAGIAGIRQSSRRRERGQGLAIAGLVLGCIWAAVFGLGALGAALSSTGVPPGSAGGLGNVSSVASTTVGSCLSVNGDGTTTPVDCSGSHDEEVFDVTTPLGTGAWPGSKGLESGADGECSWSFDAYVGSPADGSEYSYGYYAPDRAEWARGEHRVVCVVLPADGDSLIGSAKGAGP